MQPIEQKLVQVSEAVTAAGDTAFTIVTGQLAGLGADWIDKLFLTDEDGSRFIQSDDERQPRPLSRRKATKMAKKLSKHVSAPHDLII